MLIIGEKKLEQITEKEVSRRQLIGGLAALVGATAFSNPAFASIQSSQPTN